VASIQTTTGHVTADFDTWNSFAKTLLLLLMFVGGCAGSTAGGIKVVRFLVGATLNYAPIAAFGKIVLIVMMFLGRLELLAVMLPSTRSFWSR
jgi:Trk-type K+ transport system membrane component